MCIMHERTVKDFGEFTAYKVTGSWSTGPYSETRIERGVWMTSRYEPIHKADSEFYGFCVFRYLADAEEYLTPCGERVEKVQCRGTVHVGRVLLRGNRFVDAAYVSEIKFNLNIGM